MIQRYRAATRIKLLFFSCAAFFCVLTRMETGIMWIAASWSYTLSDALACQQHYLLHQCGSLLHHRRHEMERFQTGPFKCCQVHWQLNINDADSAKCLLIKAALTSKFGASWQRKPLPKVYLWVCFLIDPSRSLFPRDVLFFLFVFYSRLKIEYIQHSELELLQYMY